MNIALCALCRKKGRTLLLVSGLALGVGTAVAMTTIGDAMNREMMHRMDEFGANILVLPATEDLPLSYGGLTVSAVNTDIRPLSIEDAKKIKTIPNHQNISTIAPTLLVVSSVNGRKVLVAGLDFSSEFRLKKWWRISAGTKPSDETDVMVGTDAAAKLGLSPGDTVRLGDAAFEVAGLLDATGLRTSGENISASSSNIFISFLISLRLRT